MRRWYRVFARSEAMPGLAELENSLAGLGVSLHVDASDEGWFRIEGGSGDQPGEPLFEVERFLVEEEGIRGELNSWAAHIETCEETPQQAPLMERIIQSRQLFTLSPSGDDLKGDLADRCCLMLSRRLAGLADGVYHVDGEGFCSADGTHLFADSPT